MFVKMSRGLRSGIERLLNSKVFLAICGESEGRSQIFLLIPFVTITMLAMTGI